MIGCWNWLLCRSFVGYSIFILLWHLRIAWTKGSLSYGIAMSYTQPITICTIVWQSNCPRWRPALVVGLLVLMFKESLVRATNTFNYGQGSAHFCWGSAHCQCCSSAYCWPFGFSVWQFSSSCKDSSLRASQFDRTTPIICLRLSSPSSYSAGFPQTFSGRPSSYSILKSASSTFCSTYPDVDFDLITISLFFV